MIVVVRESWHLSVVVPTAGTSDVIDIGGATSGVLFMPSAWSAADVSFLVRPTAAGDAVPLYDGAGNLVALTVAASQAVPLPAALAGARLVALWSQTAGTTVVQGAARAILVALKG